MNRRADLIMKPENQHIELMKFMGWENIAWTETWTGGPPKVLRGYNPSSGNMERLPPLTLDLIAQARAKLTVDQGKEFIRRLWHLVARYKTGYFSDDAAFLLVNATAEQQLEALLRTVGLWREE